MQLWFVALMREAIVVVVVVVVVDNAGAGVVVVVAQCHRQPKQKHTGGAKLIDAPSCPTSRQADYREFGQPRAVWAESSPSAVSITSSDTTNVR